MVRIKLCSVPSSFARRIHMTLERFIDYLLIGISVGGQYALIAIGYTMVYGILRLINFAHGDIFMMAAFSWCSGSIQSEYMLHSRYAYATVLLGVTIERVAYKPLRNAPRMSIMISAIGVSYLLQNLAYYIIGGINQPYPHIPFLSKTFNAGGMTIKWLYVITPAVTIALVVLLVLLIRFTKIGMAMRAVSRDFETAQLMGININSVISMTFVIGSFLAGVGSILFFSDYGTVQPTIGANART